MSPPALTALTAAGRTVFDKAFAIGELLEPLERDARYRVAANAGIHSDRTADECLQLWRNRGRIEEYLAEHPDEVVSKRAVLAEIKKIRKRTDSVDLRDVPLPFGKWCVNETHEGLPIGRCAEKSWE